MPMFLAAPRACLRFAALLAFSLAALCLASAAAVAQTPSVYVNGVKLSDQDVRAIAQAYGGVVPGRYWYDPATGLYGQEGGPTLAQGMPGLTLGGPLKADASGGGTGRLTGVFINGREIHPEEYAYLQSLFGYVQQGRFWMDAYGNVGYEGVPQVLVNLAAAARQAGRGGGNSSGWTGRHEGVTARGNMVFGGDGSGCYYASGNDGASWASPGC